MHVGLVTQLFPPEFEGGTEAVVLAQARALAERGHRVDVVCGTEVPLPAGGAMVVHDLVQGVRVHRVPRDAGERAEGRLQNPLEVRPRVRDLVLELTAGVDLVHLHHWSLLDGSLVRALARRTPVAVTLHDFFALCPRGFRQAPRGVRCPEPQAGPALPRGRSGVLASPGAAPAVLDLGACAGCLEPDTGLAAAALLPLLGNRLGAFRAELDAAGLLIAPSQVHAARLAGVAPPGRVVVLPHGLCRALGRLDPAPRPGPSTPLVVAHFGNLSADKGTLDLVRTLSLLPRGRVELRLAGPVLEPALERVLRAERREGLVLAGRAGSWGSAGFDGSPGSPGSPGSNGERSLEELLAGSHLAAFPSRLEESYGLVVDEALALGLPAWVSDRGAPAERLAAWGMPGRVLPAADPLAWAEALRSVLDAPHALFEQRARVPEALPTAADAVRVLEGLYEATLASAQDGDGVQGPPGSWFTGSRSPRGAA